MAGRSWKRRWLWALGVATASLIVVEIVAPLTRYRAVWMPDSDDPVPGDDFSLVLFPTQDSPIDRAVWSVLEEYNSDAITVLRVDGEDERLPRSAFTATPPPSGSAQLIASMNEVLASESGIRRVEYQRLDRGPGDPEITVVVIGPRGRHTRSCYEVNKAVEVKPVSLSRWP